ncbi:MAG: cytidylyltransferase domain-containing protein [Spirochaetota bacterium]
MTGVFLQVRIGSTRLPGKALLDLCGRPVVEHAMSSLRRLPASHHVLLTDSGSAESLRPAAARCGFELFVGPGENVLERFVLASRGYGVDEIVRATGDNPFVSWELARLAVVLLRREGADYAAFDGPPLGTGVEVVRAAALETALRETDDPYDREHVTPYLYRNPDRFACRRVLSPPAYRCPGARVTLDTEVDYRTIVRICESVFDGDPPSVIRLVSRLREHGHSCESEEHVPATRA